MAARHAATAEQSSSALEGEIRRSFRTPCPKPLQNWDGRQHKQRDPLGAALQLHAAGVTQHRTASAVAAAVVYS
jgi:hypothetical protein